MTKEIPIIKRLVPGEEEYFVQLVNIFNQEFDETKKPNTGNMAKLLTNPAFLGLVILEGQDILGGLTAHRFPAYDQEGDLLYIYDVAVETQFQRQGWGRKLMEWTAQYCRREGIRNAFVQADQEDHHALAFYSRLGAEASPVQQFDFEFVREWSTGSNPSGPPLDQDKPLL